MSQYQGYPPGGTPPNQIPPYGGMSAQPRPRTSAAAVTSLIFGIVFCIPLVSALIAIICGIVGISATKKPGVSGRGLAIAGLVLGILGLIGWTAFGGIFGYMYAAAKPDRAVTTAFIQNLSAGNVSAAQAQCVPGFSPALLETGASQLQPLGPFTSFTATTSVVTSNNGSTVAVIAGIAKFGSNAKTITTTLKHSPDGTPLIQTFQIQ